MKSKQSVGHDGLSTKNLKIFATFICEPFSKLFKSCIQNAVFPDSLKVAKIVPLFKSGDKLDLRIIDLLVFFQQSINFLKN